MGWALVSTVPALYFYLAQSNQLLYDYILFSPRQKELINDFTVCPPPHPSAESSHRLFQERMEQRAGLGLQSKERQRAGASKRPVLRDAAGSGELVRCQCRSL